MVFQKGCKPGPGRPKGSRKEFQKRFNASLDKETYDLFWQQLKAAIAKGESWAVKLLADKVLADKQDLAIQKQFDADAVWVRILQEYGGIEESPLTPPPTGTGLHVPEALATGRESLPQLDSVENLE